MLVLMAAQRLVAGAIAVMSAGFSHEVKRTREAVAGGQVRQLLLAGEQMGRAELRRGGNSVRDVTVNTPVSEATLVLHIEPDGEGARVRAAVMVGKYRAGQEMGFRRGGGGDWVLNEARMTASAGG